MLDPGLVDPSGIRFVLLPAAGTIVKPANTSTTCSQGEPSDEDRALIDLLTPYFVVWLDRRTRAPLIPDPAFGRLLLERCFDQGLASRSGGDRFSRDWGRHAALGYREVNLDLVGLGPGLAMKATHEDFERVLGLAIEEHYDTSAGRAAGPDPSHVTRGDQHAVHQ